MFHAKKARATIRMLMRTAHHSTAFPAFECFVIFFWFFDERKHNFFPIFAQCNAHEYIMFACMIFKISQQSKLALEEKPKKLQVFKVFLSSRAGIYLSFEVHLKRKISLLMQRKNRSFLFHSLSVLLHFVSFKCFTNVFNCQNLLKSILKSRSSIIPMSILENFIFFSIFSDQCNAKKERWRCCMALRFFFAIGLHVQLMAFHCHLLLFNVNQSLANFCCCCLFCWTIFHFLSTFAVFSCVPEPLKAILCLIFDLAFSFDFHHSSNLRFSFFWRFHKIQKLCFTADHGLIIIDFDGLMI